ncbi:TatD family hydrolase [soil metagenome]
MTTFIDSHAHLADPAFDTDRPGVIARARQTGAVGIVCIGESLASAERAAQIARDYPGFCHYTAGVHPHDAADFDPARDIPVLLSHLQAGAVAVGECGLDYHYDHSPREKQRAAFGAQLALATRTGRPVVVHTREAEDDTRDMIREAASAGVIGVLHCYTGSIELAEVALAGGWYVSFSGIVTFRKWTDEALLRVVPDDRLLAESDSPYLAPVPHRGKRNEPAWVSFTVARLAQARGVEAAALGALTVGNARRLFAFE